MPLLDLYSAVLVEVVLHPYCKHCHVHLHLDTVTVVVKRVQLGLGLNHPHDDTMVAAPLHVG